MGQRVPLKTMDYMNPDECGLKKWEFCYHFDEEKMLTADNRPA